MSWNIHYYYEKGVPQTSIGLQTSGRDSFAKMSQLRGVYSDTTQLNSTSSWVELRRYRRVSIATQLNWTQLTQLNSVQPSQSCFCIWRHDLQTESTGSLRSLIGDTYSRCERVDNSTSSWVELCRYTHPFRRLQAGVPIWMKFGSLMQNITFSGSTSRIISGSCRLFYVN